MTTVSRIIAEYLIRSRNSRKRDYLFVLYYLSMNSKLRDYLINPTFCTAAINTFFSLSGSKAFKNIVLSINQVPERKLEEFRKTYSIDEELLKQFDQHIERLLGAKHLAIPQLELFKMDVNKVAGEKDPNTISAFHENAEKLDSWLQTIESTKSNQFRGLNKQTVKPG